MGARRTWEGGAGPLLVVRGVPIVVVVDLLAVEVGVVRGHRLVVLRSVILVVSVRHVIAAIHPCGRVLVGSLALGESHHEVAVSRQNRRHVLSGGVERAATRAGVRRS